jgi:hypothetical protein
LTRGKETNHRTEVASEKSLRKNMENEIEIFLTHHNACSEGKDWAVANCKTMQDVWDTAKPDWLIWLACAKGVLTEKEQHRFACWSVRQAWHLLADERSKKAVETKERWIEGEATDKELAAARSAAMDGAMDGAWSAARDAARSARSAMAASRAARSASIDAATDDAIDADIDAAWSAAWVAARDAAWDAWAVARSAVWSAAWVAAWSAQAKYIRDSYKPNFIIEI